MDTDFFARVTAAVAAPASRSECAQAAAELIRTSTAERWVGIYTVGHDRRQRGLERPGPAWHFPASRGPYKTLEHSETAAAWATRPSASWRRQNRTGPHVRPDGNPDDVPDGYRAMTDREAIQVMVEV